MVTKKTGAKRPTKKAAGKKAATKKPATSDVSRRITKRLDALDDWRGERLAKLRALILDAVPDIIEEVKWVKPSNPDGVLVWSHEGMICTGEVYRDHVKLTFADGARVSDPKKLFNASLLGVRRAIDLHEGDDVDAHAFQDIIRAAAALNEVKRERRQRA